MAFGVAVETRPNCMTRPLPAAVRIAAGVALAVAGLPALWGAAGILQFDLVYMPARLLLLVLCTGSGWAVLAAWSGCAARAARGVRRAGWILVTVIMGLAAFASFGFIGALGVANARAGAPPGLDEVGWFCPGLLVGGVWVLTGLRPQRRASDAAGEGG